MTFAGNSSASNKPRSNKSNEDALFQSISSKTSLLVNPQVTLTCYIPSTSVGAVIGRRGSTMLQIQRHAAAQYGTVRVSIVGHDDDADNVPFTFSPLDFSDADWTPVVIRGDNPCAALSAAQKLLENAGEFDEVVMDVPIARTKHATIVGKRGLTLQNLSADTHVRIMVPRRGLRADIIQLEGDLGDVTICLEKILTLVSATTLPHKKRLEHVSTITMPNLPSQTKLRTVARKTDSVIQKKKQDDDTWLITISASTQENVQAAVAMLEKWEDTSSSRPRRTRTPRSKRNSKGNNKRTATSASSGNEAAAMSSS